MHATPSRLNASHVLVEDVDGRLRHRLAEGVRPRRRWPAYYLRQTVYYYYLLHTITTATTTSTTAATTTTTAHTTTTNTRPGQK